MNTLFRSTLAALLALPLLLTGCDTADPVVGDLVSASGTITNTFGQPARGATVTLGDADGSDTAYAGTADDQGRFSVQAPVGRYIAVVATRGYNPVSFEVNVEAGGTTVERTISGPGTLTAEFINAATGAGTPGATIQCVRQQADGRYPDPQQVFDFKAVSDTSGTVTIAGVPYGAARCYVTGPDFDARTFDIRIALEGATGLPPVVVVPPPPPGALRIVLTWGLAPSDLDSHLTGPDGSGGRFHVYYVNRSWGQTNLDVDDVTSYGPETVTVFPQAEGTYRYSVFNFSNQSSTGAEGIADSPAIVEVHDHQGLVCSFAAPPAANGNTWRVFETGTRMVNGERWMAAPCARGETGRSGLGYVMAGGSDDGGVFLDLPAKSSTD